MLWLLDETGTQTAYLAGKKAPNSVVTTEKYREHSTIAATLPLATFQAVLDAYYCVATGCPEVFLVEHVEAVRQGKEEEQHVLLRGRSATALSHLRAIIGRKAWTATKHGAMVADILDDFTGDRALPLVFGTGDTLGTATSMERSWADAGVTIQEILAAGDLGQRATMVGTTPTLEVYEPTAVSTMIGDRYGNASNSTFIVDTAEWRNYAIVLGQGVGAARVRVDVDQTGTNELRELLVDADDLDDDGLTTEQYEALLAERGVAKLAEARKIEYGAADLEAQLRAGDVITYEGGIWTGEYMVTEAKMVREGGMVKHSATLGWREPGVWQKSTLALAAAARRPA